MPSESESERVELVRQATRATSESSVGEVVVLVEGDDDDAWFAGDAEADVDALMLLAGAVFDETAESAGPNDGAASIGM